MKKIVSSLIAGLMAVSLVMMGCSNDSSSDNSALLLLGGSGNGSGASGGTVAAGGAVKALADAKDGDVVDLSTYKFSDKIALTVDKAITVKNANLNGGYITLSEAATLDNVDGGTIVLVGDGKSATLKDCDAKNVIVKGSELSRRAYGFTLKIIGGVVENIVNSDGYLTIETTKTTIKKLITNKSLVINSKDDSKIELIVAEKEITLAGKLVIEKAVSENIVKVASNAVNIKKGMVVEIKADDSEYAEDGLDIEAIKAAVGELTASEGEAIRNAVTALQKEAEEMESKFQAAEEETKKALEEYEKEQAEKAVVTVYVVTEGQVSPAQKVHLAGMEEFLKAMTAEMTDGVEIGLFSDEACTKPVEVETIKAGDSIYIKVSGHIHEGPIIPGGDLENNVVIETTDESGDSVTLEETLGEVAEGYHTGVFYVTGYKATAATSMAYAKLFDVTGTDWVQLAQVQVTGNGPFSFPRFNVTGDNANVVVQVWGRAVSFNLSNFATAPTSAPDGLLDGFVFSGEMNAWGAGELVPMGDKEYIFKFTATKDSYLFAIQDGSWNSKYCGGVVVTEGVITELPSGGENAKIEGLEAGNTYAVLISEVNNKVKVLVVNDDI